VNVQTFHAPGRKKKVMKMSKFVDKIDKLLDDYNEKEDIDVLESMIGLVEDEIEKLEGQSVGACSPDIPKI